MQNKMHSTFRGLAFSSSTFMYLTTCCISTHHTTLQQNNYCTSICGVFKCWFCLMPKITTFLGFFFDWSTLPIIQGYIVTWEEISCIVPTAASQRHSRVKSEHLYNYKQYYLIFIQTHFVLSYYGTRCRQTSLLLPNSHITQKCIPGQLKRHENECCGIKTPCTIFDLGLYKLTEKLIECIVLEEKNLCNICNKSKRDEVKEKRAKQAVISGKDYIHPRVKEGFRNRSLEEQTWFDWCFMY